MNCRRQCHRLLSSLLFASVAATSLHAIDKNGVAPQAISLPSGPGSIQGLGESFQPQLNTGSGSTGVKLLLPRGPGGITPELSLSYNSGAPNGAFGLGWSLTGMFSIRRNTDRGVPYYTDGPDGLDNDADGRVDNPEELDTFSGLNGEELVPLADGTFRAENENAFFRYRRSGPGWEVRGKDGRRYLLGQSPQARIEDGGRIFEWCLESITDSNLNSITYEYQSDPASPQQRYLRRVRWGTATAYLAAVFTYEEGRPDIFTSYRSCFELRTRLRLRQLDVISHGLPAPGGALRGDLDGAAEGAGTPDALIRRYRFEYQAGAHLSLLTRVTQLGFDGLTALPSLTYEYTAWTPPDDVSAAVIRSRDAPSAAFESPSVELIDMNGDGLPDLLTTAGSQHRVFLNRGVDSEGRLAWAPSQPVGEAPPIDISSERTHLADATSDGLSDLMVKVSNTSFLCFDNTSETSWTANPFPIQNTDTWPIWPYDGGSGALSRSFDSDYSRSNDVLHTTQSGSQLWLLLPGGRYSLEQRLPPLLCDGQTFRFDLPGTHIADLNGDRLQDLAWIQSDRVVYFPNRGRGDFAPPVSLDLSLDQPLSATEVERSDFSDVDGDGLVDLTVVRPAFLSDGVAYWLNRFEKGLEGPRSVLGLPGHSTGDALRWADMNGNGTTDIAISLAQSAPGEKVLVVDLVPEGKNFLLRRADNGLGRRIYMDYESSTAQMVRAEASGRPWATRMPVAVTVVSRIREEDGLSPPYEQTIDYRDPYYDPEKQEFRGFRGAEAREAGDASAPAKVMRFEFDTGREEPCLKGKQLSEEVLGDDGTLFTRTITTWRPRVLERGIDDREVCFAFGDAQDQFVHEGEPVGIHIRSETDYDDYGNAVAERRLGIAGEAGDEVLTEREFELRLPEWRLDLVSREVTRDGSGRLMAEGRSSYDARGNPELKEAWLDTADRFIPVLHQRFDAFGNVTETTDARGNRRSMAYDSLLHALPTNETVHLEDHDLTMTAEYNLGLGVVTEAVDFALERSEYSYDPLGRLIERRAPDGAAETYEYQLGAPVSRIIKRGRETAQGATLDAHVYSDGHGRQLLTKLEAEGGRWRVADAKSFNARKLEARSWLPYFSNSPDFEAPDPALPQRASFYDAPGRVIETLAPDGGRARTSYRPLETLTSDAEDTAGGGSPDRRRADGLGRLTEVEERNGEESHLTRYSWNARGELESIVDALGNTKRFRFDSLSRLVEVDDPDRGLVRSTYDDVGNELERTDAKGQVIAMSYDAANRPLETIFRAADNGADLTETSQHHDVAAGPLDFGDGSSGTARNTLGRQAWVEDLSGETHFSYDERGNVEWVLKRVRDPVTGLLVPYRTQRQYDLLDRELAVVFPDNDILRFDYGTGSFVTSIRGDGLDAESILESAEINANGRPLRLAFSSGVEWRCEYDSSQRLAVDRVLAADGTTVHRDEEYAYDLASNLTGIDDLRPLAAVPADSPRRTTARFIFDELHRLERASYGAAGEAGIIDYAHDAIGNLLSQTTPAAGQPGHLDDPAVQLGAVSYQGGRSGRQGRRPGDPPGPHALTATASGHRLAYDQNGNVTLYDGSQLGWDFKDRPVRHVGSGSTADYVYDSSGRRVIRSIRRGSAQEEIWHIDAAAEVRQAGGATTLTKYAFLEGRRIARFQGALDPQRPSVQSLRLTSGWNLVASAVETNVRLRDAFGADAAVYQANGTASYVPVDLATTLPFGRALWVHVPAARLVTLRGLTRPVAPGDPSSPGPLHAWPRLEGFVPAQHLDGEQPFLVFDPATGGWLRRDPALPSFLNTATSELGSAQTFWSPEAAQFRAGASGSSIVFYHSDVVGSVAALTGRDGSLVEERAHYPYGGIRHLHRPATPLNLPGAALGGTRHDFTGHERDDESGLVHMGARSYLDLAGIFLSPDPRFARAAALGAGGEADQKSFTAYLSNPQMGNLYAHALRNPLKYIDPSGREPELSEDAQLYPGMRSAFSLLKRTPAGANLIKAIESRGGKILLRTGSLANQPDSGDGDGGSGPLRTSQLDYYARQKTGVITLDMAAYHAIAQYRGTDQTIRELAKNMFAEMSKVNSTLFDIEAHNGIQESKDLIAGYKIDKGLFAGDAKAQAGYDDKIATQNAGIAGLYEAMKYHGGTEPQAEFDSQLKTQAVK